MSRNPMGRIALSVLLMLCTPMGVGSQPLPGDSVAAEQSAFALQTSLNLARAHQEKALATLERGLSERDNAAYRQALLQALEAQRQPLTGRYGLTPRALSRFAATLNGVAGFPLRWRSPSASLGGPLIGIARSADGALLATTGSNTGLRLWDTASGQQRIHLTGDGHSFYSVALNRQGTRLAAGTDDARLWLWEIQPSGAVKRLGSPREHGGRIRSIVFSPDGDRLFSISDDGRAVLWQAEDAPQPLWRQEVGQQLMTAAFSPDGKQVAGGAVDGRLHLWDAANGIETQTLDSKGRTLWSIAFSPDGRWLASGSDDGYVRLWDVASGAERTRLGNHRTRVLSVVFNHDGTLLASSGADGGLWLWDVASGEQRAHIVNPSGRVLALAFDGATRLAGVTIEGRIQFWDIAAADSNAPMRMTPAPSSGHQARVLVVALNATGTRLASGSADGSVRLWDTANGQERARLDVGGEVGALAFNPEGTRLAAGLSDGDIQLWDLSEDAKAPHPLARLNGSKSRIRHLRFLTQGMLASGGDDKIIRLWDVASGQEKATIGNSSARISSAIAMNDGTLGAIGYNDGHVELWDLASGQPRARLDNDGGPVLSLAFHPNGRWLAVGHADGSVRFWDVETRQERTRLRGQGGRINALAFDDDGSRLAVGMADGRIRIWESEDVQSAQVDAVPDPQPSVRLDTGGGAVNGLSFAANGWQLASGTANGSVQFWALPTRSDRPGQRSSRQPRRLRGHQGWVWSLAFADDGRLASTGNDGHVRLWDTQDDVESGDIAVSEGRVVALAISDDGQRLVTGTEDGQLALWNPQTGQQIARLGGHGELLGLQGLDRGGVWSVALNRAGTLLANGSNDGSVQLWDLSQGADQARLLNRLTPSHGPVLAVALNAAGTLLASGSMDGRIHLWDLRDGPQAARLRARLNDDSRRITGLAFSNDSHFLAAAPADGRIRLWELADDAGEPRLKARLDGIGQTTWSVAFSPDGALLASGTVDGEIALWDLNSAREKPPLLARLEDNGGRIMTLDFRHDGRLLASGNADGEVHLWDLRILRLLNNGPAPSTRAALISETLQRLWGLRMAGFDLVQEPWKALMPRQGYYTDQRIVLDVGTAPNGTPMQRQFDLRPLLAPPAPDQDRLDQLLDWLDVQEPRLRP